MKHTSKCFLWALAWSCTIAPLAAQQTYTLDECIENALHNNARIQNAKNDLGMAEQQRQAAFTKYFPTVSATGMGFMADKDLLRMDVAPGMSMKLLKNGLMGGVNASLPPSPLDLYRAPEYSLVLTPEYNLLQAQLKASRIERKMSVGRNLPTVAIGGGFMHDNLSDRSKPFWMGFATVSIPLSGWWEGSHDMKRARLAVRNNENSLRDGSELLVINMQNTWNAMTDAYKQVQIAIESIGQAAENLRLQTDYYHAGTCTMSDLLEAQSLYQQSRDRYVESYAQYEVKKREYLQATGR